MSPSVSALLFQKISRLTAAFLLSQGTRASVQESQTCFLFALYWQHLLYLPRQINLLLLCFVISYSIKFASLLPFGFLLSSFGQDSVSADRCCSRRLCRNRVSTDYGPSFLPRPLSYVRVKRSGEAAPLIWETPHWPWQVWILACCISTNFLGMKRRDLFQYIHLVVFFNRSIWSVLWCYFLLVMNFPWFSKDSASSWQQDHLLCRQIILLIREVSQGGH